MYVRKILVIVLVLSGCGTSRIAEDDVVRRIGLVQFAAPELEVIRILGEPSVIETAPFPPEDMVLLCDSPDCQMSAAIRRARYIWQFPSGMDSYIQQLDVYYSAETTVVCTHRSQSVHVAERVVVY